VTTTENIKNEDKMKKENVVVAVMVGCMFLGLFLWLRSVEKNAPKDAPLTLESRYELNILAKKYEIPLETAYTLFFRKERVKDAAGRNDWKATIEKVSKDTGVPEKVIASFLVDIETIGRPSGNYSDAD
jgi:hypothetical protein